MSDNRTAEQILESAKRKAPKDFPATTYEEDYAGGSRVYVQESIAIDAIQDASQQTASLREENERLQTDLRVTENVRDSYKKRLEQLQEEVERLRGRQKEFGRWLMNIGISGRTFEQLWSEFEALSSKESKPS